MENVANICLITQGLLWLLVLSQVKADFWAEAGEEQLSLKRKQVAGKIKVHWVALVPRVSTISQMLQCWSRSASHWMSWLSYSTLWPQLVCQLGKSCFVYLKRSFLARNEYRSDNPDSFESTKRFWRDQAFIASVEILEMQRGLSVCVELLAGRWETCLFSWLCFPSTAVPAAVEEEEARMRGMRDRTVNTAARESASYITRSASLDSGDMAGKQQKKCPVAIFSPNQHL